MAERLNVHYPDVIGETRTACGLVLDRGAWDERVSTVVVNGGVNM